MKKFKKILKIIVIIVIAIAVLGYIALFIYASDYRTLDEDQYGVFQEPDVNKTDKLVSFESESDTGIIFYPGGRVEYIAYAPLCYKLQQQGVNVFLVDMPFNMANFGMNKANKIIKDNEEISNWYIAGHSLGGVAANMYASMNNEKLNGLIMVGIYVSMEYDLNKTVTINGSNDLRVGDSVDYTTNVHIIEGGNHAQFGNYGINEGDGIATITADEQQNEAVEIIMEFIENSNK